MAVVHDGGRSSMVVGAAAGGLAALVPARLLYGFTVDDALITARYAAHLARGLGYRFNAAGEVTDGVTPLGFPYLLAPFAGDGPLAALAAAKAMGVIAWTLAAAVLGAAVMKAAHRHGIAMLLLVLCSAPLAAWSAAGMETGLAAALGALAVALPELGFARSGGVAAGLVAALRPEALPWAMVVAAAPPPGEVTRAVRATRVVSAVLPFVLVATARALIFGRVVPLSVLAKPSDLQHGAYYAAACFLLVGAPALIAPLAFLRISWWGRGLVLASVVHFLAIAAAGGDWMPLSRLAVPALPTLVLAAAHLAAESRAWAVTARLCLALAGELFQLATVGPSAAKVGEDRARLIDRMRAPLAQTRVVAALDIGWLGAATDATIVDLAGLTDPAIAVLPGGHTSKAVPQGLLDTRRVDTLVLRLMERRPLLTPWEQSYFANHVELRISEIPGVGADFALAEEIDLPHLHYVVLRRVK